MTIPAIESYTIPHIDELLANTAPWQVDPDRAVLLIHDMQEYFLSPYDRSRSPIDRMVPNIGSMRQAFDKLGAPVLYTAQPGGMSSGERGLLADFWGAGMGADKAQQRIISPLAPPTDESIVMKWRPSAFCRTDLLDRMRRLGRDQIVITGVYANVGIIMTAHDAFSNDIETFIVADAVADFSRSCHLETLRYAASRCAVVMFTADVIARLEPHHG